METATSRVQRVRHEIKRRHLVVRRVEQVSKNYLAVTLAGESLEDFVSSSFDDHVKVMLSPDDKDLWRDYTPRRYSPAARELTIEFALHGHGPAADWAAQAAVGQSLTIAGPRGSFVVPVDYDWHVLIGDETALPAISRRLEELPASTRVTVIGQTADAADRRSLTSAAALDVHWVESDLALASAVSGLELLPGEGYIWCAGEASAMSAIRRVLVEGKGHDRHAIRAAAYWKRGAVAHHENLE